MRSYAKFPPTFWTSDAGKRIKALGPEAQVLAVYLLTSPHANMLGVYYLPLVVVCHETGIAADAILGLVERLQEAGFCTYDHPSEVVWVYDMARYELGDQLKPNDNQVKGIRRTYQDLPDSPLLGPFFDRYGPPFHLEKPRGSKGASKGLGRDYVPAMVGAAPVPGPGPKGLCRSETVGDGEEGEDPDGAVVFA